MASTGAEGKLSGRVAIVTGGSSGIGYETAKAFAKEGAKVVVAARRKDKLSKVVNEIKADGGEASMFVANVANDHENEKLAQHALSTYGALHIAFLNAGTGVGGSLEEVSDEQIDTIFGANVKSVIFGFKHFYPAMKNTADGKGSIIINTSTLSTAFSTDLVEMAVYSTSKAAAKKYMEYAAAYGANVVRVNAVAPGYVRTSFLESMGDEDKFDKMGSEHALMKRAGRTHEISPLVVYLASDDSSFVTGSEFVVDGGFALHG